MIKIKKIILAHCEACPIYIEDLENTELYDALYNYFLPEMPYGTAKARNEDPHQWIFNKLEEMNLIK